MGGAITKKDYYKFAIDDARSVAIQQPKQDAFKAFYEDMEVQQDFDLGQRDEFLRSLEQAPNNLEPFSSFQYLYQYEYDEKLTHHLKRDVSGKGARHDPNHVQNMVYHSLQQHPEVLRVYMEGKV